MMPRGHSRSAVHRDHAVIAPGSHVRSPMPGWRDAVAVVLISPRLGARFSQTLAEVGADGIVGPPAAGVERFAFVLEGRVELAHDGATHGLDPDGYAFVPPDVDHRITSRDGARLLLIEKRQVASVGVPGRDVLVGREAAVEPLPLLGDRAVQVRALLPEGDEFDMAVNTMTFAPGGALSMVEVHSMEHGLVVLEGTLVYRLGDHWHLVEAGDAIYVAGHCPQWACAYGPTAARYVIYKDWNRDPLVQP